MDFHEFLRMMSRSRGKQSNEELQQQAEEAEMRQAFKGGPIRDIRAIET